MARIDTVLLKVASRCNIDCAYCYVYHMGDRGWARLPKTMLPDTISAVIASLCNLLDRQEAPFVVVLHGGEPLLLGKEKLARLLPGLREALGEQCPVSIQTNGTLITEDFLDLCSRTRTTVAVSLDGPKQVNDIHRLGFEGQSTFDKSMQGIRRLQAHHDTRFLFAGVLSVIDPRTDPTEIYSFLKGIGAPSMDFLYQDGNHDRLPIGKASFESTEYGTWLAHLWNIYMSDPCPVPVRVLDEITKLVLGTRGTNNGRALGEDGILVIETDGTIAKNDTLKSSFDGADRFPTTWSVHRDDLFAVANTPEFEEYCQLQRPTSPVCGSCPLLRVCGGGMPLFRWKAANRYDNPSVYCRDHKRLINHISDKLTQAEICSL